MATNPFNLAQPQPVGTPFLANNGNPNTVYNTTATPFQNTPAAPMHNAAAVGAVLPELWANTPVYNTNTSPFQQPVAMPQGSAYAAPASQFWTQLSGTQRPVFNFSTSGASYPNTAWVSPPAVQPPAGNGGGGTTLPTTGGPQVRPDLTPDGEQRPGDGYLGPGAWGTGVITTGTNGNTFLDTGTNTLPLNPINSITNGLNSLVNSITNGLGFNGADGRFDVNQFIDAITEVFLPGDLYNQNISSWNSLNIATSLLNSVIPGLGNVAQWLIDKLPEGSALRSWMQRNVVQNNVDESLNPNSENNYRNIDQSPGGRGDGRSGGGTGGGGSWGVGGGGRLNGTVTTGPIEPVATA